MKTEILLETRNVTKFYEGIPAIDRIDFNLQKGEIHALVGENGAGKSTLCKVIAGVVLKDEGQMTLEGAPFTPGNPKDSFEKGISMVFQETSLVPQLTVAQNLVLGKEKSFNSVRALRNEARQILQSLNFNIDPSAIAGSLNSARRQMVEIARAVKNRSHIIILDEPTAALSPEETGHLFYLMNKLRNDGVTMIFISHALEEALMHADRITVLRNGKKIETGEAPSFDRDSLIRCMIGKNLENRENRKSGTGKKTSARLPILKVENIRMGNMVNNMSFSVYPGEVTGIAGLIGSGRSEVAKIITGHIKRNFGGGKIFFNGKAVRYQLPSQAIADGIAYVTEDRKMDGLFEGMSVTDNIGFGWLAKWAKGKWFLKSRSVKKLAYEWMERLSIRMIGDGQNVLRLSGGNQQKVVIAKALIQKPKLIIFDEPTRGVDVGAISEIRGIIRDFASDRAGVIVISSYLPEILDVADRVLVARGGTIVAEFPKGEATAEKILHAAIH